MTPADAAPRPDTKPELPPGWRWSRLGDAIREAQLGFASGERDPGGVLQLRMNNVTSRGQLDWSSAIRVPADSATVTTHRLEPGDVLFNNTNSTELVGKTALFEGHDEPVVFSNHFTRLRVIPDKLSPAFLAFWLLSQWQQRVFENICNRWIGQSAVQRDKLLSLEIPLPPLDEQKRIAAILNEQTAAVERARAAADAQLNATKALPAAYLRAVFNSPEAQHWPMIKVSQLCDSIEYGFTASADFEVREPRFLRITDIQDGRVEWGTVPGCRISSDEEPRYQLMDGDIVFARTGATTGKSYLMRNPPRAVFASYLIRIRPSPAVTAEYLYAFFQSDSYWRQIRASMRGGAQPNVNATLLGALTLPLAPLSDQQRIVAHLSEQMAATEQTRKALEEQLHAINALPAALLRRAFSGKL